MAWTIRYNDEALRTLRQLDPVVQRRIVAFMDERVARADNPKLLGERLKGSLRAHWRYRVGDHRIICDIELEIITVTVVAVGHRRHIYR